MPRLLFRSHRRPVALAATALALIAGGVWLTAGTAAAGSLSGGLYRDPTGAVVRWVAANPTDSRMPTIRDTIASQPAARWFSSVNLATIQSEAATYVGAAVSAGQVPVASVYGITNRDCGGASSGGAADLQQYQTWITNFAHGLGGATVVVILETDSIALQTCLDPTALAARNQALTTAVQTIKASDPQSRVYLDGGHSAWNSATEQANRLRAAGVRFADGFFTNVSNFNTTSNEAAYGRSVIAALAGAGVTGKHQIIDTSRNGGASGDWCADDNTDRRIGRYPTLATGDATIDGYLWVKPPGEADGCAFAAGSFQPSLAFSLATGAATPPTTTPPVTTAPPVTTPPVTTPPVTTPPVTTPPVTTPPVTTPPPTGACSASGQIVSAWSGGFQGQITVRAGSSGTSGWTVRATLPSGQTITQLWNGTLTVSGTSVTVVSLSWNGVLAPNATTTVGYLANGPATVPTLSCTSP